MEEKRLMKCTSCQAQYNVAKFQPGAKFRCAKCGTINVVPVPQAVAVTEPAPEPEPAPSQPAAPPRPTTGKIIKPSISSKRLPAAPGGFRKTGLAAKAAAPAAGGEGIDGIQIKKSNTKYYIIGIVAVVVIGIVIYLLSSSGSTDDEYYDDDDGGKKKTEKTEKKDKKDKKTEEKKSEDKEETKADEENKTEEKKADETKEEPKTTKKKGGFEVDEDIRKEVWDILREMDKQKDEAFDNSKKTIIGKGNKVIPALILAIGNDDDTDTDKQMARYASEILIKMTKNADARTVSPFLSRTQRKEVCEEWKEWWGDNQDKFKE